LREAFFIQDLSSFAEWSPQLPDMICNNFAPNCFVFSNLENSFASKSPSLEGTQKQ